MVGGLLMAGSAVGGAAAYLGALPAGWGVPLIAPLVFGFTYGLFLVVRGFLGWGRVPARPQE